MSGLQGFIYQYDNLIYGSTITAAVIPSERVPRVYPEVKTGYGTIGVTGNYTGTVDAEYEVMIVDNTVDDHALVSIPAFSGAGNGTIEDIQAVGLSAQTVTIECQDVGSTSEYATVMIGGLEYQAKTIGTAGNSIAVTVNNTMQYLETSYVLTIDLKQGESVYDNIALDFGASAINGELIPDTAPRIAFENDRGNVYLLHKKYVDGLWNYVFTPKLAWSYKAGSKIYSVLLGRTVTVTNGSVTETYQNIKTVADLWSAIRSQSSLLTPVMTSIDLRRTETSYAVRELNINSAAYTMPPYAGDGASKYAGTLTDISVTASAPTEKIKVECTANGSVGSESWTVSGSSHGTIGTATTAIPFSGGNIGFTIPPYTLSGNVTMKWGAEKSCSADPCLQFVLGSQAKEATITLTYKTVSESSTPACCPTNTFSGGLLGLPSDATVTGTDGTCGTVITYSSQAQWYAGWKAAYIARAGFNAFTFSIPAYWPNDQIEGAATRLDALVSSEKSSLISSYQGLLNSVPDYHYNYSYMGSDYFINRNSLSNFLSQLTNAESNEPAYSQAQWYAGWKAAYIARAGFNAFTFSIPAYWPNDQIEGAATRLDALVSSEKSSLISSYQGLLNSVPDYHYNYSYMGSDYFINRNSLSNFLSQLTNAESSQSSSTGTSTGYWEVNGGAYAQVSMNSIYYSQYRDNSGAMVNSQEFALYVGSPSSGELADGDTITITITQEGAIEKTYQVGDIIYLDIYGAETLTAGGGITGTDEYLFSVTGTVNTWPDYTLSRTAPVRYAQPSLSFDLTDGAMPFEVGDTFTFAIEGGHWKWRRDSGSWSSLLPISESYSLMERGISVAFDPASSPSFSIGDLYVISAMQENAASNLTVISKSVSWRGTGSITIDLGAQKIIDTIIIAEHNISGNVTFKASLVSNFGTTVKSETLANADTIVKYYSTPFTAQYLQFTASGSDITIGYIFAGIMMRLTLDADRITPLRKYSYSRTESTSEPFSLLKKAQQGFKLEYSSFIINADFEALDAMISYLKSNNDQPLYFIPNVTYPGEIYRVRVDTDNIEVSSDIDLNALKDDRIYSLTLPLLTC